MRPIYGTLGDDGLRQYRTVLIEIARKNGKSEIGAGVALKQVFADGERGAEVYSAAADRQQAGIVFDVAEQMVRMSDVLSARARVTNSSKNISVPRTGSKYRVVSADGGRQHGLNPSGVIFDEVHTQRHRRLWDAMTMGSDTRTQPLIFAITTAGVPDEAPVWWDLHEYARQVRAGIFNDRTFLSIHYGAEQGDDFDDPKVWQKANPALGSFLSLEAFRDAHARAKRIPAEWSEFLRYRLNYPTQQAERWLSVEDWDRGAEIQDWSELRGKQCFAGLDLSTRKDMTALALWFPLPNGKFACKTYFWLPAENVPTRLQPWVDAGHIEATEGNAVDFELVRRRINEIAYEFPFDVLTFDGWGPAIPVIQNLTNDGISCMECRYGIRTLSAPAKDFEALVSEGRVLHDGNPVMRWMVDCVSARQDSNGNILPEKPNRLKSEKRIDGISAALMAHAQAIVQQPGNVTLEFC